MVYSSCFNVKAVLPSNEFVFGEWGLQVVFVFVVLFCFLVFVCVCSAFLQVGHEPCPSRAMEVAFAMVPSRSISSQLQD